VEPNAENPSGDRSVAGTSRVVTGSCGSSAVIYAADGSLADAHNKKEKEQSRAFDDNPVAVPSTLVVVDMENDDQEKWTNHENSQSSRKRRPEERLQDSLRFAAT